MKIRIIDQLYLLCLTIGIIFTTISLTALAAQTPWIITISNSVLLALCVIQLIRTFYLLRNKTTWLLLWCVCAALLFIEYRTVSDRTILEAFAYGTGAVFVDYKKIIKTMKSTWTGCPRRSGAKANTERLWANRSRSKQKLSANFITPPATEVSPKSLLRAKSPSSIPGL